MAVRVRDLLMNEIDALRYEPIDKRIRATLGDVTVIDSTRAMLVWEPKRVVPTYAVPADDVAGEIAAAKPPDAAAFRPAADALDGYVIVDFDAFDAWYEEDEPDVGHPRDPFHRIDIVHSSRHVFCAYKGEASYFSLEDEPDVAWTYPQPLREAAEVTGRLAFFNELVDIVVDGRPLERPVTPWSRR